MKRFYLFAFILLAFAATAFGQRRNSNIFKVRLSDHQPLAIAIDGRYYNRTGNSLTIGDLPPGRHNIKIYRMANNSRRRQARLIYEGRIRVKQGEFLTALLDVRRGNLMIRSFNMDRDYRSNAQYYNERDEYYYRPDNYDEDAYVQHDYRSNDNNPRGGNDDIYFDDNINEYDNNDDRYNNGSGMNNRGMSAADMNDLEQRVNDRITDTDKEKMLKQVLEEKRYTTDQVRTMAGWLSFESTKLSFAKWAYKGVADRNNYWKLDDIFSFSSSKEEFTEYIGSSNRD